MTHREAIALIDHPALRGFTSSGTPQHWADLGCGSGTFTLALAHFLPSGSTIEAIDLQPNISKQTTPSGVTIAPREADFTSPKLGLHNLDGILMANAIHYVADKPAQLQTFHTMLRPGGALLLVEYDTDTPVPRWVPYPLSFAAAARVFVPPHWSTPQKLHHRPSAFGRSNLYSAWIKRLDSLRSA